MADRPKNSRHDKRVAAFKLLFAREFNKDTDATDFYTSYLYENVGEDGELSLNKEYSSEYVKNTYFGVSEKQDSIDTEIEETSIKWKMTRMSSATRTILRLAVYELVFTETPPKVVINEALSIAREYDDEAAPSFINGILNKIARNHGVISEENNSNEENNNTEVTPDETV